MSEARFDISLPFAYKASWREAYRPDKDGAPRLASYQAPDGEPVPFIYKSLEFSGGQSVDTSEYPFFGLWSNEALNQKTQSVTVQGCLRGEFYLQQRADFLDALTAPTTDDSPGFFDHPLWGRFKVVVENYTVQESADANGQCEISLALKRAGVSLEARVLELSPREAAKPEDAADAAVEAFSEIQSDPSTLTQAFGRIKALLLNTACTLQLPVNILNSVTGEIAGIANLIAQGVQLPGELARALANAALSMAAAVISIGESAQNAGGYFSSRNNNYKKALLNFLSAADFTLPAAATVRQEETKKAAENLYRAISLCASAKIMAAMENTTRSQTEGYWALYCKLEDSLSLEDPAAHQAVTEMRSALSARLRQGSMARELKKTVGTPAPFLYLSHYLGCDEGRLRLLNDIEDSFLVSGEVLYV